MNIIAVVAFLIYLVCVCGILQGLFTSKELDDAPSPEIIVGLCMLLAIAVLFGVYFQCTG